MNGSTSTPEAGPSSALNQFHSLNLPGGFSGNLRRKLRRKLNRNGAFSKKFTIKFATKFLEISSFWVKP